ncbi:MAG: carboxypeptidase-like regulatory domain-containing protein [Terriglobales bacterium]
MIHHTSDALRTAFPRRRHFAMRLAAPVLGCLAMLLALAPVLPAQTGTQGGITVLVTDPSGGVVSGATLTLTDLATGTVRSGVTQSAGTYSFVGLPAAEFSLTVIKQGFQKQVFGSVTVQTAKVTDLRAALKVGAVSSEVVVSGNAVPIVETTTNAIGTTIDLKQVNDLPLGGRNISQLAQLVPGATANSEANASTWDGLPTAAQGNNVNGVVSSSSRMKFDGNSSPAVSARLEDMQEMTVQTDQLGLASGNGQSNMQVSYVTKRGSNAFHGSAYEDFRNSGLNANSWYNNAAGLKRNTLILNDFGGTFGGPLLHDKFFFFGSFATSREPGSSTITRTFINPAAQAGNFTFKDNNGNVQTVNVLTDIAAPNGLPSTVNSTVAGYLQAINDSTKSGGVTPTTDPNVSQIGWLNPSPRIDYFPALRLDYDAASNLRIDFNFLQSTDTRHNTSSAPFPGAAFANRVASNRSSNFTAGLGVDWTISPTLINQFRGGYLYDATWYAYDAAPLYDTLPEVTFHLGNSGQNYHTPITTYYPVVNFDDNASWQKGSHLFNFGITWYREQDHYWNDPLGYPVIDLRLTSLDPARSDFANSPALANAPSSAKTEAENLYAELVGRIDSVKGQHAYDLKTHQYLQGIGEYPLDELQKAWGLYFEDSYHVTPTLTLNYGLRWDFTGDDHDLTSAYTSADLAGIYGPTAPGDIFQPGVLNGVADPVYTARSHQYQPWNKSPQPAFGFAWNPSLNGGWLSSLLGSSTVIRGGYALRDYTEPNQFFWNDATNYGFNYYQSFSLNQSNSSGQGTFAPGSLALGDALPPYLVTPTTFQTTVPESSQTFFGFGVNGLNPKIRQPYVQSWNLGIQRELGNSNVLEVRYVANHTVHQWVQLDPNEVNVFENGFLNEFKAAQNNLAINAANGAGNSFANNGYAGQVNLPIMTTAGVDPTDGGFIQDLQTGAVGDFANTLATNRDFLCPLVGSANFSPCAAVVGANVAGAYPLNFFQANPFGTGGTGYMTDAGYGNYNALQVDFRQKQWHGLQFDVNYTWAHTLGVEPGNDWTGSFNNFSMRNLRLAYGPTIFDIRHSMHAYGTYDLPFGRGKAFLNGNGIAGKVLGNWTVGSIVSWQGGTPYRLNGGYSTFNDYADGGVHLAGTSLSAIQNSVGAYSVAPPTGCTGSGCVVTYKNLIGSSFIGSSGANASEIAPNTTPGTIASNYWLHNPSDFNTDLSLTRQIDLTERWHMQLQGEFLNAFNHPIWGGTDGNIRDLSFGQGYITNNPREVQLRANFTF